MEPQVQYAKTSDGVSIAYCTLGEGTPFIQMTTGSSHLQLEWHYSGIRTWYERLAEKRMLVRYDGRGTGLSERDVTDYSLDARVRDFEAVVEHLGLDRFALWGAFDWGPVAVAYAVRHPQRVSHLILWCTYASTSDPAWAKTLDDLIMTDWEMATETMARGYLGRTEEEEAHGRAALVREAITPEAFVAITRAADQFDVTDLLGRVRSPTLVMHRRQLQFTEVSSARNLASRIPDARLVVLEGETPMPFMEDTDAVLQAIDEFLGEGEDAAPQAEPAEPGAFRTILFTDVEGSTAFTERLGDARARDLLREHERIVREALKAHGGSEVKTMGDGFMTSFSSATRALECAIAIQKAFDERNRSLSAHPEALEGRAEPIKVRI
ncbi:MAG: adenylate/guanylate cyclase domain-containing protein, partial [Dehalococcoidia bacterium]